MPPHVVIIGAGPAGLTAGYLLIKENIPVTILEEDPVYVGGIAKTAVYKDYCFDIGGHRFFSKSEEVESLWSEILPDDMLERPRSSRIFYRQHFFAYPLKAFDALYKLGIMQSFLCVVSYVKAHLNPINPVKSFSDWVINHFGHRLYSIFFKTYTEKVWGMRCEEISADWAAQRIKGLSLASAIYNAIVPAGFMQRNKKKVIKTLIDSFRYPRKGPGMLWNACADKIRDAGGQVRMGSRVHRCEYNKEQDLWTVSCTDAHGDTQQLHATHVISSAPLRELSVDYLQPPLSKEAMTAASALKYRDFLIVVLILKDKNLFHDNWIYIHDPEVEVARIQNFKSWSPDMVPEEGMCSYGLEYFCFKDDKTWSAPDDELIKKASAEIVKLGLASLSDIVDGCVVRQIKAYPVYDRDYQNNVAIIRDELEAKFPSLYLIGRNGMHKYNNQDHAMMTAMLTVKNIIAKERQYDVWCVNQDAEYIETVTDKDTNSASGLRAVPQQVLEQE